MADVPMPAESNQRRDGPFPSSSSAAGGAALGRRASIAITGKAVGFDISSPNAKSSALSLLGNEVSERMITLFYIHCHRISILLRIGTCLFDIHTHIHTYIHTYTAHMVHNFFFQIICFFKNKNKTDK